MSTALKSWVERHVGPFSLVNRRGKARQTVLEILDAGGERWFVKQAHLHRHWASEARAYRNWTPDLPGRTPILRAANERFSALLLSAVPGHHPDQFDGAAHREAGRVLRMLHESRPARSGGQPADERVSRRLEAMLARTPDLFTEQEVQFARLRVKEMGCLSPGRRVPCHGDYKPRNWVVDPTGPLRVIDFGESRWHLPAFDLTRLYLGVWWSRPDLARAFLKGYGRALSEDEEEFIRLHLVLNAMVATWYGHTRGSAEMKSFGKTRLRQLVEGHTVTIQESVLQRSRRRARTLLTSCSSEDERVALGPETSPA